MRCAAKLMSVAVVGILTFAGAPAMAKHVPTTAKHGDKSAAATKHLTPAQRRAARKAHRLHRHSGTGKTPAAGATSAS